MYLLHYYVRAIAFIRDIAHSRNSTVLYVHLLYSVSYYNIEWSKFQVCWARAQLLYIELWIFSWNFCQQLSCCTKLLFNLTITRAIPWFQNITFHSYLTIHNVHSKTRENSTNHYWFLFAKPILSSKFSHPTATKLITDFLHY